MKNLKQAVTSKIFRNFSTYLGLSFLAKLFPFFLIPVLTRYLRVEEYGLVSLFTVFLSFLTPFVGLGLESNITRNFFTKTKDEVAQIVFHLMIILLGSTLVTTVFISVVELIKPEIVNIPPSWALILPLLAFFNTLFLFNLVILRNQQNAKLFGFFEAFKMLLEFAGSMLLVAVLLMGAISQVISLLLAAVVTGLVSYYHIYKSGFIKFKYDKQLLKSIFILSLPFIPHSIGGLVINTSGRYFIDQYFGKEMLAYYAVIFQFSQIFYTIIVIYNRSSQPWVYQTIAKENEDSKFRFVKMFYVYLACIFVVGNLVGLASYLFMPYWVDPRYIIGTKYLFVLVNGFSFFGLYTLLFPYYIHYGKTKLLGSITSVVTITNILLMMYLIPRLGIAGAAWGQFITNVLSFLLFFIFLQPIARFPWLQFSKVFKTKLLDA